MASVGASGNGCEGGGAGGADAIRALKLSVDLLGSNADFSREFDGEDFC